MEPAEPADFDWEIDEQRDWPPSGYPRPPVSPSLLERLRACRLRACFEASSRTLYPRRRLPAARLGIAFHAAMRDLELCRPEPGEDVATSCRQALAAFDGLVAMQRAEQAAEPRERTPAWPLAREQEVRKALIRSARSAWERSQEPAERRVASGAVVIEQQLRSADGLVEGTPDRVERVDGRLRIVDYKTSLEADEERDARQVQLYSALLQEQHGEWPGEALVVYELRGRTTRVGVDQEHCRTLIADARAEAERLLGPRPALESLANPGDACGQCQFRPWCAPFWTYQSESATGEQILAAGGAGIEGAVLKTNNDAGVALLETGVYGARVRVRLPLERFPLAAETRTGDWVRILDTRMTGAASEPTAELLDRSEVYRVLTRGRAREVAG